MLHVNLFLMVSSMGVKEPLHFKIFDKYFDLYSFSVFMVLFLHIFDTSIWTCCRLKTDATEVPLFCHA